MYCLFSEYERCGVHGRCGQRQRGNIFVFNGRVESTCCCVWVCNLYCAGKSEWMIAVGGRPHNGPFSEFRSHSYYMSWWTICVLIFSFHVHFYFLMVTVTGDHRYLYKARTQFYTSYGGIAVCVCLCVFVVTMHRRFNSVPINHGEPLSQPYIYRVN